MSVSGVLCKLVLLSVPCSGRVMQWTCVVCTQGGLSVVPLQNVVLSAERGTLCRTWYSLQNVVLSAERGALCRTWCSLLYSFPM